MEGSVAQQRGWININIQREDFTIRVQHTIQEYGGGGTALKQQTDLAAVVCACFVADWDCAVVLTVQLH